MLQEKNVQIGDLVARSREHAEKLTDTIDQWNQKRGYKPLLHSRERFVFLLTSRLAKLFVHRRIVKG